MNIDKIINLSIYVLSFIMVIAPFIKDPYNRDKRIKNVFKKITWSGWLLIILMIITLCLVYWKDERDEAQRKKDKEDFMSEVRSLKIVIDSLSVDPAERVSEGYGISGILMANEVLDNKRKFIYDVGETLDKNRASIYVDADNNMVFRIIDDNGETYSVKATPNFLTYKKNAFYFLYCDIGYSKDYSFMRIYLDD
jgi:hypothetical protein